MTELVEVREGRRDVGLHLLELSADLIDPVDRRGAGDLSDRFDGGLDRLPGGASLGREFEEVFLQARRTHRERLEALVAGCHEALDRLIAREERHDPLLLRANVGGAGPPDLGGDLTHKIGGLSLDHAEHVVEALVDRPLERLDHPMLGRRHHRLGSRVRVLFPEAPTPRGAGMLRLVRGSLLFHVTSHDPGPPRNVGRSIGHDLGIHT